MQMDQASGSEDGNERWTLEVSKKWLFWLITGHEVWSWGIAERDSQISHIKLCLMSLTLCYLKCGPQTGNMEMQITEWESVFRQSPKVIHSHIHCRKALLVDLALLTSAYCMYTEHCKNLANEYVCLHICECIYVCIHTKSYPNKISNRQIFLQTEIL